MTKEKIVKDLHKVLNAVDITFPYRLELINAIEYLLESSLPSNIDEAAEEYVVKAGLQPEAFIVIPSFKAGAELMAQQGETFSQKIQLYKRNGKPYIHSFEVYDYNKHAPLFNPGEEVTIQVRKKQ